MDEIDVDRKRNRHSAMKNMMDRCLWRVALRMGNAEAKVREGLDAHT